MNRTGLIIALAIAAVVGAVFAIYPQLDVAIAALFYNPTRTPSPPGIRIASNTRATPRPS